MKRKVFISILLTISCLCISSATSTGIEEEQPGIWGLCQVVQGKEFVNLTHTFSPVTPVWEGFPQAEFEPAINPKTGEPYTYKEDGFIATTYTVVGQYGTHCDPPCHFAEGGATLDEIPLKQMILPLCVIDITGKLDKDPAYVCTVEDIRDWEKKHDRIPEGAFVALRTDIYKDWHSNPSRFKRHPLVVSQKWWKNITVYPTLWKGEK
jgi:kynurenine formamidase